MVLGSVRGRIETSADFSATCRHIGTAAGYLWTIKANFRKKFLYQFASM
jgi:hypothetical protein